MTDHAATLKAAIGADKRMRSHMEKHKGTYDCALAVQKARLDRDAKRAALPPLHLVPSDGGGRA